MSGIVLAEGVVEVTADAKGVGREIAQQVESDKGAADAAGKSIGKSIFGGIMSSVIVLKGLDIVGNFFGGAISGASDLNETISKSSTIFGTAAKDVESWASGAAQAVGLSKAAAMDAAAGFGNMFTQIGFGADEAARLSKETVQMAADLGSFNNVPTADVADRISAAFRGEYDSLQALIPNINAARVEQEAMAATGKANASELTAQEKAAAVLAIVNRDGAAAMGDFAKTADGAANTQKTLTASLEDQQSKLGQTLMPLWSGFLSFLSDTAIPVLTAIVDWISQNASWLGPLATALAVVTGAVWLFNIALNANPIMLIITAIALLVGGILWVATQTTFFQDVWTNVTTAIGAAWQWLWDSVLSPVFTAIADIFTWIYNSIIMPVATGIMLYIGLWAAVITWLWEAVISPVFAAIGAAFSWIWGNVISPIIGYIQLGIQAAGAVFSWLYSSIIQPVFAAVGAAFNWVWRSIISPVVNSISGAIRSVGRAIRDVFGGIGSFIGSAFQAALSAVRGPINGIIGLVNSAISGINSLSVTIPDWVPIVGGQTWGLSIPTIPMLARGSKNAPDVFIAGEAGPELIVGAGGSKVYPADETRRLRERDASGDTPLVGGDLIINEAQDPLGSAGRVGAELRKWRKK